MTGWQTGLLVVGITGVILIFSIYVFCQKLINNSDFIPPNAAAGFNHILSYN